MAPQQRKRSAAAQRNLERMGYSMQQNGEDGPRRESESVTVRRVKLVLTFLRQAILSLRTPGIIHFIPIFSMRIIEFQAFTLSPVYVFVLSLLVPAQSAFGFSSSCRRLFVIYF